MARPLRLAPFLAVAALAAASVVVPVLGRGVASAHDEAKRSLYDRLGGAPAITAVCDEFLARFGKDARFAQNAALAARLKAIDMGVLRGHLIAFVAKATGGPDAYTGRDMRTSHAGLKISEQEWTWSVEHLTAALDTFKVPEAEKGELLAAVGTLKADIVDQKSLYDRLGGHKAIEAVCDEFLARFGADARFAKNAALAARLKAIDMDTLRYHLIAFVAKATGGPSAYTGRDMKSSHVGLRISEDEWTWSAEHLTAALDKFKVPAKEKAELLALVGTLKQDIVADGNATPAK